MERRALIHALKEMLEEDQGEIINNLEEETPLREGLGLDSVDLITLVMQVQDRFRVILNSDELEHIVTVRDLVDILQRKIPDAAAA